MKQIGWFLCGALCGGVSMLLHFRYSHLPHGQLFLSRDWLECEECEAELLIESVDWDEC